jgi:hypothetical protein
MADETGTKKAKVLDRDWNEDHTIGTIKHIPTGEVLTLDLTALGIGTAPEVARQLAIHGWHQKVGDTVAKTSDNPEADFDKMASIHERLLSGMWTVARESAGPRPTLVAEAVMRVASARGVTFNREKVIAKYSGKDGEAARKAAMEKADVVAAYKTIIAENAAKRAQEATAKLGESTTDASALV